MQKYRIQNEYRLKATWVIVTFWCYENGKTNIDLDKQRRQFLGATTPSLLVFFWGKSKKTACLNRLSEIQESSPNCDG